jgi:hypothetical protein
MRDSAIEHALRRCRFEALILLVHLHLLQAARRVRQVPRVVRTPLWPIWIYQFLIRSQERPNNPVPSQLLFDRNVGHLPDASLIFYA